jgi:hypothetical protein
MGFGAAMIGSEDYAGEISSLSVAIHYWKKRTITGCVRPGQNGMIVSDEKDKLVYRLSGDTTGAKPGDRIRLQGKKVKSSPDKPIEWKAGRGDGAAP